jgi:hypothetical protein
VQKCMFCTEILTRHEKSCRSLAILAGRRSSFRKALQGVVAPLNWGDSQLPDISPAIPGVPCGLIAVGPLRIWRKNSLDASEKRVWRRARPRIGGRETGGWLT